MCVCANVCYWLNVRLSESAFSPCKYILMKRCTFETRVFVALLKHVRTDPLEKYVYSRLRV